MKSLRLKCILFSALAGLFVGFFWEGYGAIYLWDLANPKVIMFVIAMIAWPVLGLIMGFVLKRIEACCHKSKVYFKPLVGPLALVIAKITSVIGIISFRPSEPLIFGVPSYMMIGMVILVYLLDDILGLIE